MCLDFTLLLTQPPIRLISESGCRVIKGGCLQPLKSSNNKLKVLVVVFVVALNFLGSKKEIRKKIIPCFESIWVMNLN